MVLDPSPPPLCVTPCNSSSPHLSRSRSRCRVLCYPLPFTLIVHIVYMLCVMCYVLYVICYVLCVILCVMCYMLCVMCYMLYVICYVLCVICYMLCYVLCYPLPSINTVHNLRGLAGTWVLLPSIRLICRPRVLILVAVVGVVLHIDSKTRCTPRDAVSGVFHWKPQDFQSNDWFECAQVFSSSGIENDIRHWVRHWGSWYQCFSVWVILSV